MGFRPARLLREIHHTVTGQQETFGNIFRGEILPGLEAHGVSLLNDQNLSRNQKASLKELFQREIQPLLEPAVLEDTDKEHGVGAKENTFLDEGAIYLVVELWPGRGMTFASERPGYGLLKVPSPPLSRFFVVPGKGHDVIFLEDVIRLFRDQLFPEYG